MRTCQVEESLHFPSQTARAEYIANMRLNQLTLREEFGDDRVWSIEVPDEYSEERSRSMIGVYVSRSSYRIIEVSAPSDASASFLAEYSR